MAIASKNSFLTHEEAASPHRIQQPARRRPRQTIERSSSPTAPHRRPGPGLRQGEEDPGEDRAASPRPGRAAVRPTIPAPARIQTIRPAPRSPIPTNRSRHPDQRQARRRRTATVFLADDPKPPEVALKIMHPSLAKDERWCGASSANPLLCPSTTPTWSRATGRWARRRTWSWSA
jgi:hypothetical protein